MSSVDLVPVSEFRNRADDSMEFLPWDSPASGTWAKKKISRPAAGQSLLVRNALR